jgi:ferredoxin-NADP reductase
VKSRFTAKFFKDKVSNESAKFLICGPPFMMRDTPPALIANGIDASKIHIL